MLVQLVQSWNNIIFFQKMRLLDRWADIFCIFKSGITLSKEKVLDTDFIGVQSGAIGMMLYIEYSLLSCQSTWL